MLEALKLDDITVTNKLIMIEALWDSLRQESDSQAFTPQWHLDELHQREESVNSGQTDFSDLNAVKERLQKRRHEH